MRILVLIAAGFAFLGTHAAGPVFLDDQFELPEGFRIYRAAERDLTGGSYALRFDGQGRLLVGDGTALRRLTDSDNDGVLDHYEVIATGLGSRGPQGILPCGDRLFAVGGDGIQLYEGYNSGGALRHVGRIGPKLNTGGDHESHTLLLGHDGYIYFMAGNNSGHTNRSHITEPRSPARMAREASVFRISPDGRRWECVASGGRNSPSLGMNYLGDLFSFDSDMEWHVALPWYRPVRLNHWVVGGDQGWQEVGAYPPYFIDNLPGILDVGRGSPDWGIFYEHNQFPARYLNSFLVCDYRWKSETTGAYESSGRLVSFFLQREGSRWKAEMQTLARAKPDARDAEGRPIPFALVDVDVAPDGSIYLTEHNQGVWRILYDPNKSLRGAPKPPGMPATLPELLAIPQPSAEWSRRIQEKFVPIARDQLVAIARDSSSPVDQRLRAIRYLASNFATLKLAPALSRDPNVEIRAQAAWLAGLNENEDPSILRALLVDHDPFVRRRAAEALTRNASLEFVPDLKKALNDSDRTVRYTAMMALSHLPPEAWFKDVVSTRQPQVKLRALTAARLSAPSQPAVIAAPIIEKLVALDHSREDTLDLLRVIHLYEEQLKASQTIRDWLFKNFPHRDPDVAWEQARVLGAFEVTESFPKLLNELRRAEPIRQFHYFQSLAKMKSGWTTEEEQQALDWVLSTQQGWFAEMKGKGVQFPSFFQTALADFVSNHLQVIIAASSRIQFDSLLSPVRLTALGRRDVGLLFDLYKRTDSEPGRVKILNALSNLRSADTAAFLRLELGLTEAPALRKAAIVALKQMPKSPENEIFLRQSTLQPKVERTETPLERTDAEIHKAILESHFETADAARGRAVYERLQCHTCHGGGKTPGQEGRIFGPDLAAVTARLSRAELADSLVYPSKQVADRFKAVALTLKDGRELTGFITERTTDHLTFADATTVHRLAPSEIEKTAPQEKSLMPEGLLRSTINAEIDDLLKFLSGLK